MNRSDDNDFLNEDALLFSRFLDGEDEPFEELFDRHNRRLFLYCTKLLGDAELAGDIAQEVWERVIRLRQAPQRVANPGAFLATIARNLCFNALKQRRRRGELNATLEIETVSVQKEGPDDLERLVAEALDELPVEHREVLILQIYCDYRYEEIADMLGRNVTAIRMRASRARAQLRKLVESKAADRPSLLASSPLAIVLEETTS